MTDREREPAAAQPILIGPEARLRLGDVVAGGWREDGEVIRFEFALDPIGTIEPWTDGRGGDPQLHWFGLTLGQYRVVVDDQELLDAHYQIARLWEDVLERLPRYLEPTPDELVDLVRVDDDGLPEWTDGFDDDEDAATAWRAEHHLRSGHLALPAVRWWRTVDDGGDVVWTAWRHDRSDGSVPLDAPGAGLVATATDDFVAAVADFDRRLMMAMAERIAEVERGALPSPIRCDVDALRRDQAERATRLADALQVTPDTDWARIQRGAARLWERQRSSSS